MYGAGQLNWWTPGGFVSGPITGPTAVAIPFNSGPSFFPLGASSNGGANGFLSATLRGFFSIPSPGSITINLGSDDDAWVFIDGILQVDDGGVHAFVVVPTVTSVLSAGSHTIDVFFADRHTVQSQLAFSADVNFSPVPEPSTLAVFGLSLLGIGIVRRRTVR